MSLVLALQDDSGRWLLAGDSAAVSNNFLVPSTPKVWGWHGWAVGGVGGCDDEYAYFWGLKGDEDLSSPEFHVERMTWWRSLCERMGQEEGKKVEPDIELLIAKEHQCYQVYGPTGQMHPVVRYAAIGAGRAPALLILSEEIGLDGPLLSREETQKVAMSVIERVATMSAVVRTPVILAGT